MITTEKKRSELICAGKLKKVNAMLGILMPYLNLQGLLGVQKVEEKGGKELQEKKGESTVRHQWKVFRDLLRGSSHANSGCC